MLKNKFRAEKRAAIVSRGKQHFLTKIKKHLGKQMDDLNEKSMLKSQLEELRRKIEMMERVLHERDKEKELTEEPKEEYVNFTYPRGRT